MSTLSILCFFVENFDESFVAAIKPMPVHIFRSSIADSISITTYLHHIRTVSQSLSQRQTPFPGKYFVATSVMKIYYFALY